MFPPHGSFHVCRVSASVSPALFYGRLQALGSASGVGSSLLFHRNAAPNRENSLGFVVYPVKKRMHATVFVQLNVCRRCCTVADLAHSFPCFPIALLEEVSRCIVPTLCSRQLVCGSFGANKHDNLSQHRITIMNTTVPVSGDIFPQLPDLMLNLVGVFCCQRVT